MMWPRLCAGVLAGALAASVAGAQPPGRELTLDDAVRTAVSRRAEIEAARADVAAAAGAVRQADVGRNPTLSVLTEDWRWYGTPGFVVARDLEFYAYLTQPMEIGGKRRLRTARARADARLAEIERTGVEWRIRQSVTRAYWRALAARARRQLLEQTLAAAGELARYHEVRWREGAATEADWIKVRLEEDKAAVAHTLASLREDQARYELLREMGEPFSPGRVTLRAEPFTTTGTGREPAPAIEQWLETALTSRPEIQVQRALVESMAAAVQVAEAAATPDVSPYVGYKRTMSLHTLVAGASVALPFRDRNQGRITQTRAVEHRERATLRALETRVRGEVVAAATALRRRSELVTALTGGMTARAAETLTIAEAAYREGGVTLLYLLDARRSANDVALLRTEARHDYQLDWVDLQTAVGTRLEHGPLQSVVPGAEQ